MKSEPIAVLALEADQQCSELINPSKRSFNRKPLLVDFTMKISLSSTFGLFAIAFVLWNVRTNPSVPEQFPCFSRIKGSISVEESTFVVQPTALHVFEQSLNRLFEVEAIIMLP
jgi:hypothetical protein